MLLQSEIPSHPGIFLRKHVIPSGMSVTDAAKRLEVGRPALSNLLNGKSSLSPRMATRLEKAFGANSRKLLDLQAAFDRHSWRKDETAVAAYVPPFLTITARQIHGWADSNIEARRLLPVLLRKLIHSTVHDLHHVDFPGYDNAERRGWDGLVEAGAATSWVPEGKSGWEFSANKDPRRKAERDYEARVRSIPPAERMDCTFVFVTLQNWPGKTNWIKNKRSADHWKDVRALDASDLEQWLEQSIPARMWLAEQFGEPGTGFETLDRCWRRWAEASNPALTPAIFGPSLTAYRNTFNEWLGKPSERTFTVAADSKDEALAFLSCLFQEDDIAGRRQDLAAVFDSVETLRKLAMSNAPFLPVVHTDAVERELASIYRARHCIVVRPRNAVDSKPDIAVGPLDHDAFKKALTSMGLDSDEADRLTRESGRSPTILRRRLSKIDAIRRPAWSEDADIARGLIPMALVGAWCESANADQEILSIWRDGGYEQIEENITHLLRLDDSPVWSVGQYRGIASKIDALFAIRGYVTKKNLDDFFCIAEYVLSETDPALELPESERWAAGLHGKVRNHSTALRNGICETLVLLSVHGKNLFQDRLSIDAEAHVAALIHKLLTPLTLDTLLSHSKELPYYAEAAPEQFLNLVEMDLQQPAPVVHGLLKPADSGPFAGGCPRTGLLWALECLAWKHLWRVSVILARLSKTAIHDNWINKPITSLQAIYRFWRPQTAASLDDRNQALETLTKRFPEIGWDVCITQLNTGPQVALPFQRPRWRGDALGAGHMPLPQEIRDFMQKTLNLVLAWPEHDWKTLGDLVERVEEMPCMAQNKVWSLISGWAELETDDRAKAKLRNRIRRFALTRYGQRNLNNEIKNRARLTYAKLEPSDLVIRHSWLFANHRVNFYDDEDEDIDYDEHAEKIRQLRVSAINEIWMERAFEGVTTLLSDNCAASVVGKSLASTLVNTRARVDFLRQCISAATIIEKQLDDCVRDFLLSIGDEECEAVLLAAIEEAGTEGTVRLLRCAPFAQRTWLLLDRYGEHIRARYWREVTPRWNCHGNAELCELVDRLLEAKRPRAAFNTVYLDWSRIETSRLKRLLFDVGTVYSEPNDRYVLEPYQISEALSALDGRPGVTPDEMVQLEFMFIEALRWSKHRIPNLERHIAESPLFFVQVLALMTKRDDDGEDPPEWRTWDPERGTARTSPYSLLDRINHLPGTSGDGKIDIQTLADWVTEARRLCADHGRAKIGDHYIGQLLSRASAEEDGSWPCLPVCEAMERNASSAMGQGFRTGVMNARGVTMRELGEGGAKERELAEKYRDWASRRAIDCPYISNILEGIAAFYDWNAKREDDEAKIEERLGY